MKKPQAHTIQVSRTARYFQLGALGPQTKRVWYALHGYGQLASYFVRHFTDLEGPETAILAPEGLSRFYLGDNVWERVGASWMTKEDRLQEIEDQLAYLNQLHDTVREQVAPECEFTVLGFSQGVATAWRWMRKGTIEPHNFVLWAGSAPQDQDEAWVRKLRSMKMAVVLGSEDQYIQAEKARQYLEMLKKIHPWLRFFPFEGDHRMDRPTLAKVNEFLYPNQ